MINYKLASFCHEISKGAEWLSPIFRFVSNARALRLVCGRVRGNIFIRLVTAFSCRFWMRLVPKPFGDLQGVDPQTLPPRHFIAGLMQLPMMSAAERYSKFVADLETERPELREPQVMRIGRLPAADDAGLRCDESQMSFVTQPLRLGDGENALVDLSWDKTW